MSRHINSHFRDTKLPFQSIKDFNHSVDVKKFSKERNNGTPTHIYSSFHQRIQQRSNDKIRHSQPNSLGSSFAKNISQKNMKTKRKLSSGFQIIKTNHHSVSIDHHLLKEKYFTIQELFERQQFAKVISMARQSIPHFEHSQQQQNLYYWMAIALGKLQRYEEALEEISQGLDLYPSFQEGFLLAAELHLKLKQYKSALQRSQDAITINPKTPECYLQLSFCFGAMKQYEKEKNVLEPMLEKFPKQPMFLMLLLECCIKMKKTEKCEHYVNQMSKYYSRKDSLIQKAKSNFNEAYILFDEALKFNNNKIGVNRSLLESIKIEIQNRDFYKAYHSVGRIKHLQLQESQQIKIYTIFIEGVMTMMKKKSQEAINILLKISSNKKCQELQIQSLVYKYMAYGYFKLEQYSKAIKYYQKIPSKDVDQSSLYNRLLAEGIELSDQQYRFQQAINKFRQAANVYPQKVEPYIYTAMTLINQFNHSKSKDQIKRAQVLIQALKEMEKGSRLNPNSSNLLYHRTIIHIYFEDWKQAHDDINRCIQKAQENLPKYFYLRGVCYSCIKDFKKAINQFSICLSLNANFQQAHFQKAKCFFLLGNTQKGFSSLKSFIELNPDDLSIYKWIGDLLYEGKSYRDALKSYAENKGDDLDSLVMRTKCLMRVGSIQEVGAMLKLIQKNPLVQKAKINLDNTAFSLLGGLLKGESGKVLVSGIHKLNKLLEQNNVGYVFQLIDCMNLLGTASFYIHKYTDAYESFLLVLQLYQSLCEKYSISIRAEQSQQQLDLRSEDIYFNIVLCEFARGHISQALNMIQTQYIHIVSDLKQKKKIQKLMNLFEKATADNVDWDFKNQKPINNKLKKVDIDCGKVKIRTKPVYNLYHENAENLYASEVADKIIKKFHAGYIDTMPQGPWIKRNPFGVVFTDDMMPSENSISLEDTFRPSQSEVSGESSSVMMREEQLSEEKKTISKKQQFLKKMQFDAAVQEKLNKLIKSSKQIE